MGISLPSTSRATLSNVPSPPRTTIKSTASGTALFLRVFTVDGSRGWPPYPCPAPVRGHGFQPLDQVFQQWLRIRSRFCDNADLVHALPLMVHPGARAAIGSLSVSCERASPLRSYHTAVSPGKREFMRRAPDMAAVAYRASHASPLPVETSSSHATILMPPPQGPGAARRHAMTQTGSPYSRWIVSPSGGSSRRHEA